ncbi:MAG: hypothetical protein QF524_04850, partial [Planctomycetota bacterium]|nr:hypothetical protein [Planctomycetota bacterium]
MLGLVRQTGIDPFEVLTAWVAAKHSVPSVCEDCPEKIAVGVIALEPNCLIENEKWLDEFAHSLRQYPGTGQQEWSILSEGPGA